MTLFYDQEAAVPRLPDPVLRAEHGGGGAAAAHRHPAHVPLRAPRPQLAPGYNNTSAVNRSIGEVVQSRRRPLLGPSPG